MKQELLEISKEIDISLIGRKESFYEHNFKIMSDFLKTKFCSSENKNKLVYNLDILLKYTNFYNLDYLKDLEFVNNENFIPQFIKNLDNYRFAEDIDELILILEKNIGFKKLFSNDNIKSIFMLDSAFLNKIIPILLTVVDANTANNIFKELVKTKFDILKLYPSDIKKLIALNYKVFKMQINNVLENCSNILILRNYVSELDETLKEKIDEYINNNEKKAIRNLFYDKIRTSISKKTEEKYRDMLDLLKLIVLDICSNEKVNLSDVNYLDSGTYSDVYQIGSKVLKIGIKRKTPTFKNIPYIVKPLLRINYNGLFIECTEMVKDDISVSEDQMYELYKSTRNFYTFCFDIKSKNIGILLKDNKIYWNHNLNVNDKTLGLEECDNEGILLKEGDYIFLDNDILYTGDDIEVVLKENETEIKTLNENLINRSKKFEKKFLMELKELIEKINQNNLDIESYETKNIIESNGFRVSYIKKKLNDRNSR